MCIDVGVQIDNSSVCNMKLKLNDMSSYLVVTVPCCLQWSLIKALLFDRTQHVLAAQTVTKAEFRSSQTHKFEAITKIIPVVQAKGNYSCINDLSWV